MKTLGFKGGILFLLAMVSFAVAAKTSPNQVFSPPSAATLKRSLASSAAAVAVEDNIRKVRLAEQRKVDRCERYGNNPILCCLAHEEQALNDAHIASGPLYKLNNNLIDEMRNIDQMWPTPEQEQKICHHRDFSPSVALLRALLVDGMDVFVKASDDPLENSEGNLQNATAIGLVERAPRIFFDYISALQSGMDVPNCLNKHIPELMKFQNRLLDLENERVPGVLIDPTQVKIIFAKLRNLDTYAKDCAEEGKKRRQQQKQAWLKKLQEMM